MYGSLLHRRAVIVPILVILLALLIVAGAFRRDVEWGILAAILVVVLLMCFSPRWWPQ